MDTMNNTDIIVAHYLSLNLLNEDYVTAWRMVRTAEKSSPFLIVSDSKDGGRQGVRFEDECWKFEPGLKTY